MSKILQLIDAVNDSELTELSLEEGGEKVKFLIKIHQVGGARQFNEEKNTSGWKRRTRNFPERIWMRREKKQKANASLLRWWELSILPLPRRTPLM